jgi:hypothetical protein
MPNPGSNNQYEAQHIDCFHGTEPYKVLVPGSDPPLEPKYLVGFWNCGPDCEVTIFDGSPAPGYALGLPLAIPAGKHVDLGSPGFPLTGSGLFVSVTKTLAEGAKLHIFIR